MYLSTFAWETPQRTDTNLIGLAHDALDEIDRLRLMIAVPPQAMVTLPLHPSMNESVLSPLTPYEKMLSAYPAESETGDKTGKE